MQIDHPKEKCRNPSCDCDVEAGHPYCSEHCRTAAEYAGPSDAANANKEDCSCAHDDCSGGRES